MKKTLLFFKTANYILIVTGIFHLIGHFNEQVPANDKEKTLIDLMKNYYINMCGIERSMQEITDALSLSLSLFTFFIATFNLIVVRQPLNEQFWRKIILLNIVFLGVLEIIMIRYTIPPPMICYGLAWLCMLLSYFFIRKTFF